MSGVYRGMSQAELDAGYDNTAGVADSATVLKGFDARSAALRAVHGDRLDLQYGPAPRNRIDYFASPKPGPLLVFIHGGYWQMRAKETFSFLAAGPLVHGFHVAMVGYTLAPEASLTQIVDEIRLALRWLAANAPTFGAYADRMVVSGWSAGGQLAGVTVDAPGVVGAVAISGIFDLTPIQLSYLDRNLRLTEREVADWSPLLVPQSPRPMVVAFGTAELPELQRQSKEFAAARDPDVTVLLALPGTNHFTVLEELAAAEGVITRELCRMVAQQ